MKRFHCGRCGQPVFFESTVCVSCGALLGFDKATMEVVALAPADDGLLVATDGTYYRACRNGSEFDACNWVLPASSDSDYCWACRFNRTIPDQGRPRNNTRLRRFEAAKKRLVYTLLLLELPLVSGFDDPDYGLLFDLVEDRRSDADRFPESFVQTGFHGGVITINTLEADDDARESMRVQLNENYRTLLGHLRHESGHYFWAVADPDEALQARFHAAFGDPSVDYAEALGNYYADGPRVGWQDRFISAYASAHPAEDWAECWAHYLLIYDAIETAAAHGMVSAAPRDTDLAGWVREWRQLSVALNELNRSTGLGDAYPFVVNDVVLGKLTLVDEVVSRLARRNRSPAGR